MSRNSCKATALPIAGLVPLSMVDWPGQLVATIFVQGCPWRCQYCHNTALLDCRLPGVVPWAQVEELLAKRRGLLDGVVFSGGEATRHPALGAAMRRVREAGFRVGLHTGGAYPRRLAELTPLLDWVGFDVKGLPADYPHIAGAGQAQGERSWRALAELTGAGIEVEARLTVYPGSHSPATVAQCAARALAAGAHTFALQQARDSAGQAMTAENLPLRPHPTQSPVPFSELAHKVRVVAGEKATIRAV